MYHKFYGFKESPFTLTPNSKFFFPSAKHTEALNAMVYAIEERKGFVVITGEIGSGKTTVCRTLLNKLEANTKVALIANTHVSSRELLMFILDDLEVSYTPGPKSKLIAQLNNFLIEQLHRDNNVVLIIDEAQNLTPSVLEEVRMLSNLETETEKLIQIIFLGQPELREKLALSRLKQLQQRIAVYFHLNPLTRDETREYVYHRLRIASGTDHKYFTNGAIDLIYQFSQGTPRLINQICDSALLAGYASDSHIIDEETLKEVIIDSPMNQIGVAS